MQDFVSVRARGERERGGGFRINSTHEIPPDLYDFPGIKRRLRVPPIHMPQRQ
ncbi:hypothetical protein M408DRAFT_91043 [Serendipita vermifera MAFF 305830]|uniref:Uncharacterized protein n=1 Tax=Serendipita vermifera MAFF 305830 TaxID=933852 RepID=A0A0C3BPZ2_SERVB|nr:hypothetical protein M408DRAFT_91043 [Serendipita vermifera MAFF 305830]